MPHLTKAQAKRMLKAIDSKSKRLWGAGSSGPILTTPDMIAIEKIVARTLKRLG
jgi:hypothetical protein